MLAQLLNCCSKSHGLPTGRVTHFGNLSANHTTGPTVSLRMTANYRTTKWVSQRRTLTLTWFMAVFLWA